MIDNAIPVNNVFDIKNIQNNHIQLESDIMILVSLVNWFIGTYKFVFSSSFILFFIKILKFVFLFI